MTSDLSAFEKSIGYVFNDKSLLITALTHSSYVKTAKRENPHEHLEHNERLEFLGDAVLGLCVGEMIFKSSPHINEGLMSRMRAAAVCEDALYDVAKHLGIGALLKMGAGEERSGGRNKPSILSDALEAVIGAIYLDGGIEPASCFIKSFTNIGDARRLALTKDCKTRLQELTQEHGLGIPAYSVIEMTGPEHNRSFTVSVTVQGEVMGTGSGHSKQDAGQAAASVALDKMITKK